VTAPTDERRGPAFWVGLVIGGAIMAWGAWLFVDLTSSAAPRRGLVVWIVGIDLLHDLVLVPVVLAGGWLMARFVPARHRGPVHAGVVISAFVLVLAYLPLRGSADGARNPTIQPLDYRTSTLTALALVWSGVGAWALVRWVSDRHPGGGR